MYIKKCEFIDNITILFGRLNAILELNIWRIV